MFISIKDLEIRRIEFREEFPPGTKALDLGDEMRLIAPVKTAGRAEMITEHRGGKETVEDIRVVGDFATELEFRCARCLESVKVPLANDFDALFRPLGIDARAEEASINEAETEIGYYDGEGVLLEDVVKEQILLAAPVKMVCAESCQGLCPQCGKNLNVEKCDCVNSMPDPRWAALEDIRKKLDR